jgi:hypothetical protein
MQDARVEYEGRLEARQQAAESWDRRRTRLGWARLAVFAAGVLVAVVGFSSGTFSAWWSCAAIPFFAGLVIAHDAASRGRAQARRAVAFYERGLENLDCAFAGSGNAGQRFQDSSHPYTEHLDIFGSGSLFERLCRAQTPAGEETLARWLCEPASPSEIRERQAAVAELSDKLDLREDLAVLGPEVRAGLDPEALASWGQAPSQQIPLGLRALAAGLAGAVVGTGVAALVMNAGLAPFLLAALGEVALALPLRGRVRRILGALNRPLRDLALLVDLLERIEGERFRAPLLVQLRSRLDTDGIPPSREIARLHARVRGLEARNNQLFAPLAPFLLWGTQFAFAIEAWRIGCGPHLSSWLAAVGEIEALADLSGYAYEEADAVFPEICQGELVFEAEALGHPLLPRDRCVTNDLRLDASRPLLVVSGSNMSGKSTLLRTVGVSTVLALAGAPVRARRLRLCPLAVGASLAVRDSLAEGASYFYAEITCLRRIVELAESGRPVLYLLDEILGGTNSHDRGIGATAVLRGLLERGAIGLITTHDLTLTHIADELAPRAANVHFEDQLVEGRMSFDYKLRDGVVTKSNALELMRSVGLEV